MAYVIDTGLGQTATIGTAASRVMPASYTAAIKKKVVEATPILLEQIKSSAPRKSVPSRSASAPAAPATPAAPAAPAPSIDIPMAPLLQVDAPAENYTWYYVGGGVALVGLGVAAYLLLK